MLRAISITGEGERCVLAADISRSQVLACPEKASPLVEESPITLYHFTVLEVSTISWVRFIFGSGP